MAQLDSKTETLKSIEEIEQKLRKLETRRNSLAAELEQSLQNIGKQESSIRAAMIDGTEYAKALENLQLEKAKSENLRDAILQAAKLFEDLSAEKKSKGLKIGMIDLLAAGGKVDTQILLALRKIDEAITAIDTIQSGLSAMNEIASAHGLHPDHIDETKGTLDIYHYIRQWVTPSGVTSFRYQLAQLENAFPVKLQAIRGKRAE